MTKDKATARQLRDREITMRALLLHDDLKVVAVLQLGIGCDAMRAPEIAERLGISISTVVNRMRVVLKAVKDPSWTGEPVPEDSPVRKRMRAVRGRLDVCGMTITRHGEDEYRIDGCGPYDAEVIGRMIAGRCSAEDRPRMLNHLRTKDGWICNAFKAAFRGPQWPYETGDAVRLPITTEEPEDGAPEARRGHDQ